MSGWIETGSRYLPLDTLRAAAFGLVFLQHTLPTGLPGGLGRDGVDLFFVLSGYLITGGLIRSTPGKGFFSRFYLRRSLRIFPAYYVTIMLAVVVIPSLTAPLVPWSVVYLGNFGYLIGDNHLSAIAHLWSLAVEEQFYLLWPAALWLMRSRRARWWLVTVLIVAAPFIRWALFGAVGWQAAYALLPSRMDTLALGAAIAMAQQAWGVAWFVDRRRALLTAAFVTGLIVVAGTHFMPFGSESGMTVEVSLVMVCCGFVVAATIGWRGTALARAMSLGPIVYVGQISYGLYLIHRWVVEAVKEHATSTPEVVLFTAVIALALAMVSFHLFERPINNLRHRFEAPTSRPAEVAVAALE